MSLGSLAPQSIFPTQTFLSLVFSAANKTPKNLCLHCGTSNPHPADQFCCSGCEFVYQTLTSEGLHRFYDLRGSTTGIPVKDRPFQPQDLDWLTTATAQETTLTTAINGVTCIGCVWLIEKLFLALPGAQSVAIFPDTGQANFTWASESNPLLALARDLPRYGYNLAPLDIRKKVEPESARILVRLGLCSAFALNAMAFTLPRYLGMTRDFAFAPFFELVTLISSVFCLLLGGSYFFARAAAALRQKTLHIDLPISLGILLAFAGSLVGYFLGENRLLYFDFVAIFTTLMLSGRYLHLTASEKARSQLTQSSPISETTTLADHSQVPTASLHPGDHYLLPPGQPLPVTSFLRGAQSSCSLAWINGEPEPQTFAPGQRIPSGAINLAQSSLSLEADEAFPDSLVAKLTQPSQRSETSPLLQKVLKSYLLLILVIGILGGLGWLITTHSPVAALQVTISIFIVSCPCAIGVAIPLIDRRSATRLQGLGVFVRNPALWGRLLEVQNLIFDKTGTLTLEHPTLNNPEALDTLNPRQRELLYSLSSQSLHPLSRTLHATLATNSNRETQPLLGPVTETPALGLTTVVDGRHYQLGKPPSGHHSPTDPSPDTHGPSCTFSCDGEVLATFHFRESARPDAARSLAAARLPVHILSGDHRARVHKLAEQLQLNPDFAHGQLDPKQKADLVAQLNPALYLGDGANDSLAFEQALVTGAPVADRSLLDTKADFLFTQRSLSFLPQLLSVARHRRVLVNRVLAFTILYNTLAVIICLNGQMNPLLAAILMPLSSLFSLLLASTSLHPKANKSESSNLPPITIPKPSPCSSS